MINIRNTSLGSSNSSSGGSPTDIYNNGKGPIFIGELQCPITESEDAYVTCLHEIDLGISECDHTDDIGVICEGIIHYFI